MSRWTAAAGKEAWKEMDGLATLSKHFTTIAYDRRESGLSGGRVEALSWDLYVKEAHALLNLAGFKSAYILGCCMGASLATAFATRHPEACKGLLLHWPVGGFLWKRKGTTFFQRHIDFVKAQGMQAVIDRAPKGENFWIDPEIGPWGSPSVHDPQLAQSLLKMDRDEYISMCEQSRDHIFTDTMPCGASGDELMGIQTPALIMSGADSRHTRSASWALKELLPNAELWPVFPPDQTGDNTLEQVLNFKAKLEHH